MKAPALLCLAVSMSLGSFPVRAAPAQAPAELVGQNAPDENRCQSQVLRFEQSIGFIRNSQGTRAAAEVKERLLPARLETDILFKEGYCGLASYLKGRKLID